MKVTDAVPWWHARRAALLALLGDRDCAYVYDLATVREQAEKLLRMRSLGRVLYALKANPHPEVLRTLAAAEFGFECVSLAELERVCDALPGLARDRVLFTPNFAPQSEYRAALEQGFRVTVDNLQVLRDWASQFHDRDIFLRFDATSGHGHHEKVRTGGRHCKFGVPPQEFAELPAAVASARARVVGLHAHGGSGSFEIQSWLEPAAVLASQAASFREARILNLGGGLGVPDRSSRAAFDLEGLDAALLQFKAMHPALELWLEPGRFLVAEAGVLLARVTQTKGKGDRRYVGVATGMNSLIRPALYGAHHEVRNLTRLEEDATVVYTVVGPICESGDELAHDCRLPRCAEGDVLLIANTGAYGHAMASHYNLRPPAPELVMPE